MDENLLKLLRELRQLKNAGELDDEESLANQTILWRNRLEYDVLEKCLKHYDEEIRLLALAVLVESKKSTQCFTQKELDIVTMFLTYNLGEKMEYVPLIKKALKRMKESLAVLRRHIAKDEKMRELESQADTRRELYDKLREETTRLAQESLLLVDVYRAFFQSFREICVQGLRPGSTNSRKRSSLLMLRLGQEFLEREFKELPWRVEQADKLFECLLLDTYETNKEIMYEIARDMEPRLLRLDDPNRVREIIDVALELGNCIRPIDGITASYMLKICLLSPPVISNVLESYTSTENLPISTVQQAALRLIVIVVERLKGPLKLAEENIVAAAGKHSLYGYLFCIRNLLGVCDLGKMANDEASRLAIGEIIEISFRLNNAVSKIVNNSSPEGHLPMDMESGSLSSVVSQTVTTSVTPQMVLICSWRTVKEVSLLFGYLSSKSPIAGENTRDGLLSDKQLVNIGEHLVTLLFETKHRGAFEQAHVGFGQLCNRLWRLSHKNLRELPKLWLHHLLLAVSGLSPGNAKLCATRRSAGVPFMVQALVSSDPLVQSNPTTAVFHSVVKILLGFANLEERGKYETTVKTKSLMYDETIFTDLRDNDVKNDESKDCSENNQETVTEIKTHALNILRALFKHAQLGDLSRNYAADGLSAAIRSYDGKTWAERNAATLLFSSLITRIFGVQRTRDHVNLSLHNKMTGRIFFERYPSLLTLIPSELRAFVDSSDTLIKPSVQSILLLLSRLYPSFNSDDADSKWKIDEFIKLVSACAKSRVYKTRELAARALVPLLTEKTVRTFIVQLFDKISTTRANGSSLNAQHGYMLQILEIMTSPQFAINQLPRARLESFLAGTGWIIDNLESNNDGSACFPLATAYLTALCELVKGASEIEQLEKLFHRLVPHLGFSKILKQRPGREIYELAVAKFLVAATEASSLDIKYREEESLDSPTMAWNSVLSHDNVQVQIVGWSGVSRVIEKTRSKKLLDIAILLGLNNMTRNIFDPDLRDGVYDFFYELLIKSGDSNGPFDLDDHGLNSLCSFVVTVLASQMEINNFPESPSFMRLLGKAYGKLPQSYKDEYLTVDHKRTIYKNFLDNTWMGSGDTGCGIAISSVLRDLFVESSNSNVDHCLALDWWTCLLNLLVNDNTEVRKHASLVVCGMEPSTELECICGTMDKFFDKFFLSMRDKPRSVTFAALFAWSTFLSGDADYEMDESDVFNKCYNYEIFEPLKISDLCVKKLKSLLVNYSTNDELPIEVINWLNERLRCGSIDIGKFKNARELITEYGKTVPIIDAKLEHVIDPTHNDKLLRATAYEKFASIASGVLTDQDQAVYSIIEKAAGSRHELKLRWSTGTTRRPLQRLPSSGANSSVE